MRKEITPEDITAVIDTNEKLPLDLSPIQSVRKSLPTADYSILGLEDHIAIERKSLPDLLVCVGVERKRFDACVQRMLAYETRAIVVEASWLDIERGDWRSKVLPQAALGSLLGWIAMGVPVVMAGDRANAALYVSRILFIAARRRWRELLSFKDSLRIASGV